METEEQKSDRERLTSYIERENIVSIMNDTKWERARFALLKSSQFRPLWKVQYLRSERLSEEYIGDLEWTVGSLAYRAIEWVDIDPVKRLRRGRLVADATEDFTQVLTALLKENHIPFSMEGVLIRIWGYQRPGQRIIFESE